MPGLAGCDQSLIQLRRDGWTFEETTLGVEWPINPVWVVWGQYGENRFCAHGGTRDEAWLMACELAEAARKPRREA